MTAADKFGIAFSIGITVALIAFAMSFSATDKAPTVPPVTTPTPPTPAPIPEPEPTPIPTPEPEIPTPEPEIPTPEPEPEPPVIEEPPMEEPEVSMSADVSIPAGSSTPGCETTNECFIPYEVTIGVGGTVTWTNDDTAAHTVTSGSPENGPDGVFDSSILMAGKTFEHTFDEAGEYDYFCIVHPWMTGKVNVE